MTQLSVISTGTLEAGFKESQVVHNIISAFKLTSEDAVKLLEKNAVIRKNVSQDFADKLADRFSKHGLKVVLKQNQTPKKKAHSETLQSTLSNTYESKEDFEKLLTGEFTRSKISFSYRCSLLLALMVSLIAPIVYVSVLFSLLYLGGYYASFLSDNLGNISGGFLKLSAIIIPYFIITVLTLFLLRPLFSSYQKPKYFEMRRIDGPALFNLIDVMCERISVPFPDQICLDTEVNASAGAMYGYSSLGQKKLRLTIGLPLLLGLNVRQFSGILAHEFGHFAQSSAMKTYYVVNAINFWFCHRAYVPDTWDERLEEWSDKADWHLVGTLSIFAAQQAIKLTRCIFKLLYKLNYRLTQYMSRAMEYDADSYESRFVGSNQFEPTSINMRKLCYATSQVNQVNKDSWNDERLLANLPLATIYFAEKTDETIEKCIKQDMQDGKTSSTDSHPADNDRIKHIAKRNDPGIFTSEFPAKQLIKSIDKLCEAVTIDTYTRMGIHNPRKHIVANHKLIDRDERKEALQLSYQTFFNGSSNGRLLNLTPLLEEKPENHIQCMNAIRKLQPQFSLDLDKFYQQLQQINQATLAKAYWQSNIQIDPADFNLKANNIREVEYELGNLNSEMKQQQKTLFTIDQLFYQRILFNKTLLSDEQKTELDSLLKNLQAMYVLEPIIIALQCHIYQFNCLLNCADELHEQIMPTVNRLADLTLAASHQATREAKNIKIADEKFRNMAEFIESWSGTLPTQKQIYQLDEHFDTADEICKAIHYQYYWHFAEVAELCSQAERLHKISPLSFPPQKTE